MKANDLSLQFWAPELWGLNTGAEVIVLRPTNFRYYAKKYDFCRDFFANVVIFTRKCYEKQTKSCSFRKFLETHFAKAFLPFHQLLNWSSSYSHKSINLKKVLKTRKSFLFRPWLNGMDVTWWQKGRPSLLGKIPEFEGCKGATKLSVFFQFCALKYVLLIEGIS